MHLSNYKATLCSSDCDISNCSSHCDVRICSSQCDIHIYSLHCGVTMFGRLHCCYVRHLTIFGNAYQIGASVYVRHIVMLLCMVDGNITKFDTLGCLEMFFTLWCLYFFVTLRRLEVFVMLWRQDMYITLQCEEMFIIMQWQGNVGYIATSVYVRYIVTLLSTLRRHAYVLHIVTLLCLVDCNFTTFFTLRL